MTHLLRTCTAPTPVGQSGEGGAEETEVESEDGIWVADGADHEDSDADATEDVG